MAPTRRRGRREARAPGRPLPSPRRPSAVMAVAAAGAGAPRASSRPRGRGAVAGVRGGAGGAPLPPAARAAAPGAAGRDPGGGGPRRHRRGQGRGRRPAGPGWRGACGGAGRHGMWQGHAGGAGDGVGEGPPPGRRPAAMCHDRLRPNMGKVARGRRHPWTPSHPAPSVTTPPTAPEGPAAPAAAPKQRRMSSCFLPNCRSPTRKAGQSSEALQLMQKTV
ncbi:uncharacterized protein LOC143270062 [Peromyscus maniculatus bairdii]|uniref:uncharacterized protein LOC143269972 n=1 Tax=Peromyscus maniculatus bairdii TaxID=230844 RepID=UPI003FCF5893